MSICSASLLKRRNSEGVRGGKTLSTSSTGGLAVSGWARQGSGFSLGAPSSGIGEVVVVCGLDSDSDIVRIDNALVNGMRGIMCVGVRVLRSSLE